VIRPRRYRLEAKSKAVGEGVYVEHNREPESLPIDRHPFIPRDGLTSPEDLFDVPVQPAWRGRSGKFPERRLGAADL